ncbi:MAG: MFS transporter, partial [Solirubrobacterales bacterium]
SFPLLGTVIVASSFEARRGRAMALATQGITVAGVVLPGLAAALIVAFGWRAALQLVAVALFVAILPLGFAARRSQRPASRSARTRGLGLRQALRLPAAPRLLVVLAAAPLVSTALVLNSVSLLASVGLSAGQAALALGAMAACVAVGAAAGGMIADRCAVHWSLAPIGVTLAIATGLMLSGLRGPAFAGFLVLGLANGLGTTANGTVWARTYGTAALGRLQGMSSSAQIAGAALGPLVLAASAAVSGGYLPGLLALAALSLVAVALGWRCRPEASALAVDRLGRGRLATEPA